MIYTFLCLLTTSFLPSYWYSSHLAIAKLFERMFVIFCVCRDMIARRKIKCHSPICPIPSLSLPTLAFGAWFIEINQWRVKRREDLFLRYLIFFISPPNSLSLPVWGGRNVAIVEGKFCKLSICGSDWNRIVRRTWCRNLSCWICKDGHISISVHQIRYYLASSKSIHSRSSYSWLNTKKMKVCILKCDKSFQKLN